MLDRADHILFMIATVLLLWGASLAWRAFRHGRLSVERRCPECRKAIADGAMRCTACGYESDRGRDFRVRRVHHGLGAGGGLAVLAGVGVWVVAELVAEWGYRSGRVPDISPGWRAAGLGFVFFGLLVAVTSIVGRRSGGTRHCPKCWYDMNALVGTRCPECGHDAKEVKKLYRRRRRYKTAVVGVMLALVGVVLMGVPTYRQRGWVGVVPTTALIVGLEYAPDPMTRYGTGMLHVLAAEISRREVQGKSWDWQVRWRERVCRRLLETSTDAARLDAITDLSMSDPEMYDVVIGRAFHALGSNDQRELDTSLANVANLAGSSAMQQMEMAEQWNAHSIAGTDRILALLATAKPGPTQGLAALLSLRTESDEALIHKLIMAAAQAPPEVTTGYHNALSELLFLDPRGTRHLEECLDHGSAAERFVCIAAASLSFKGGFPNPYRETPENVGLARALRCLVGTVEGISGILGITRTLDRSSGGRLWASSAVIVEIWDDLLTPRLTWIEAGLQSDADTRDAACSAAEAVAKYTPISCEQFRTRLEELAGEGVESAKEALEEMKR